MFLLFWAQTCSHLRGVLRVRPHRAQPEDLDGGVERGGDGLPALRYELEGLDCPNVELASVQPPLPVLGFQNDTLPSQHPAHSTSPNGCHASDLTSLLCPAITTRASSPALEYT